jgi:hypothetical protein
MMAFFCSSGGQVARSQRDEDGVIARKHKVDHDDRCQRGSKLHGENVRQPFHGGSRSNNNKNRLTELHGVLGRDALQTMKSGCKGLARHAQVVNLLVPARPEACASS